MGDDIHQPQHAQVFLVGGRTEQIERFRTARGFPNWLFFCLAAKQFDDQLAGRAARGDVQDIDDLAASARDAIP